MITTVIHGNGFPTSNDLELLFARFETEILEPSFEQTGALREVDAEGRVHYLGNFIGVSHGFHITTNDPDLIERMDAAIAAQLASDEYQKEAEQPGWFERATIEAREHSMRSTTTVDLPEAAA